MAIYRTGTASLAANGVVIGVGTKWQDKLSLIRVGATIMFPTVVGAIGTISAIVSDTELRVMTTNGAVVPAGSQYVILLHDSITVDGLAQDVAETLRYYQSKETEVADAIDFFKTFDWEQFKVVADKVTTDAAAANDSKLAAAASETAALASKNAAAASQTAAAGSATAALASQNAAKTSENNAKNYADSINPSLLLTKNQNLADLANKDTARTNLALDRFRQFSTGETQVKSGDATKQLFVKDNGEWGCWDITANKSKALTLPFGGTGASDAAGARDNFDVYSKAETLDAVGIGASPRHIADMADIPKGFARIVGGSTIGGIDGLTAAGWIAQVDGSPSYAGMFVQPDGNRVFAGGQSPSASWSWHEIPTLDRHNTFNNQAVEVLSSYPGLELTTTSLNNNNLGKTILIENDVGNGLNFSYKMLGDNTGRYTIRLPKPGSTSTMTIGLDGGLAPTGDSFNNGAGQSSDFNNGQQGWRKVAGAWSNGPYSGNLYGHLFSHTVQGLNEGGYNDTGRNGIWSMQRFYDTSNRIFTRGQTNNDAWSAWLQLTTSAVSDERLKNVLGNLNVEGALDNINRMEFKLFKFKEEQVEGKEPTLRRGVISQQLRLIDKEYTKEIGGYYHLDQTPMLLDGLAAIKALRERDEDNKVRIAKLESDIEELKAMVLALSSK